MLTINGLFENYRVYMDNVKDSLWVKIVDMLHNSFELVRFYREANNIPVDDNISQLHDIDWQKIIDWLNQLQTLKIQVISKSMNGFNNLRFVSFTKNSLAEEVGFSKWIL